MSPTQVRSLIAAFLLAMALSSCGDSWPGPVRIDETLWDVDIEFCGPSEVNNLQWAEGTITNTDTEMSPYYQTSAAATYADGSSGEVSSVELIPPLEPNQSYGFRFSLPDSVDKEVVSCEVWIVDSVSNYTD